MTFDTPIPVTKELVTLLSLTNREGIAIVYRMSYLTDKEEKSIDELENTITIDRDNQSFTLSKRDIYGYGLIDFSEDSTDCQILATQTWLLDLTPGKVIPVFNYGKSTIKKINGIIKRQETWNVGDLIKYGHCQLGKPNKIIIFKETNRARKRL